MKDFVNVIDLHLGDVKTRLIGDPHQGRSYRAGVPLHRRGEREQMNMDAFEDAMLNLPEDTQMVVIVGDIFDKFVIPPATLLFVTSVILRAATRRPDVSFVTLRGNHDASRDADLRSSFDILVRLLEGHENIYFAYEEPLQLEWDANRFLFIPWHPFISASDMVEWDTETSQTAVFGHWDIEDFGGDNSNLIPTEKLAQITDLVITGHVHQRQEFDRDGVKVIVTGSLLPQAHGEDLTGEMFVTVGLEDLDGMDVTNKCVRLRLRPGEEVPVDLDCLQLTIQRVTVGNKEVDLDEVEIASFDLKTLWDNAAEENAVSNTLSRDIWGFLKTELEGQ